MPLLFDRLLAAGVQLDPNLPIIDASAIAQQIDSIKETNKKGWPSEWYGRVAPPFKELWIEAHTRVDKSDPSVGYNVQRGVYVRAYDIHKIDWQRKVKKGTRWILSLSSFQHDTFDDGVVHFAAPVADVLVYINEEGHLLTNMRKGVELVQNSQRPKRFPGIEPLPDYMAAPHSVYALKALAAMNQRCPVDKVSRSRNERRRIKHELRADDMPPYEYYVMQVRPTPVGGFEEVGSPETHMPAVVRDHAVRGHFRWYSKEKPLFGNPENHGLIWVDSHRRGDSEAGSVDKDYRV